MGRKRKTITTGIEAQTKRVIRAIESCIQWWPEEYTKRGKQAIQEVRAVGERLLNTTANLSKSEIDDLFIISSDDWSNHEGLKTAVTQLKRRGNPESLMIAAVVHPSSILRRELPPDPIYMSYKSYCLYRRQGTIWKKKRKEIIQERERCEDCGSTENLEVHHIMGLGMEGPEHLRLLCRDCHRSLQRR